MNCTVADNSAGENGSGLYCWYAEPVITNCILWDGNDEIYNYWDEPVITYSNVYGGWIDEGNIFAYPYFTSYKGFDYLLMSKSRCIDAGDPSIEDEFYDWHPRWPGGYTDGIRSDMGAYGGPDNDGWLEWLE